VQVDIDLVDDEEAQCDALQRIAIGEIRPQDQSDQPQDHSPNDTTLSAQGLDQHNREDEDEHHDQDQEENNEQDGDEDDGDKGEAPPHPRVHHNV
jgi:hypothetical protein